MSDALLSAPFFRVDPNGPSLADVQRFEALSEEVQLIARKALGAGESLAVGPVTATSVEAYRRGWEDAMDAVEIQRESPPRQERIIEILKRDH